MGNLTVQSLIALLCADVDIFLLQEEDQLTDKTKLFTVAEIRNQLHLTNDKMVKVLQDHFINVKQEIK